MKKMPREEASPEADLRFVQDLVEKGQLDEAVSKLDPADVAGTLKRVPLAVVRLLATLHASHANMQKVMPYLTDAQRKTIMILARVSKKHQGGTFVTKLIDAMKSSRGIRARLGVDSFVLEGAISASEAKIFNTVTEIKSVPQFMLNSGRVYIDLSFMQGDDMLWRCKMELDEVLATCAVLLSATEKTLNGVMRIQGIDVNLLHQKCAKSLGHARKALRQIPQQLRTLQKRSKKSKPSKPAGKKSARGKSRLS